MPLASIDIGSNTLRLLIGRIDGNKITRLRCEMAITRLAENISETGLLNEGRMKKSLSVLKKFSRLIKKSHVSRIRAVGTSALREAKNSKEFIDRVLSETGLKIAVISGKKEAELTAKGVLFDLQKSRSSFIIDIGGGSTEWIVCKNSLPVGMGTMPTGVVKLFENHMLSDPPSRQDIISLNIDAKTLLNKLKSKIGKHLTGKTLFVGTAGTITTLASIDLELETYNHEKVHMHSITLGRLYGILERLAGVPLSKRRKIRGLEPGRADLIIPGLLFTINIMETLGFRNMLVSDNGVLEGALINLAAVSA